MKHTFLHVGCGTQTQKDLIGFKSDSWDEIRFDIDPKVKPDIVGNLNNMSAIETASVNAVYSSHNLEHLFAHEVVPTLKEMRRVLSDDGFVVITCPDLQSVCKEVANGNLLDKLYNSPSGPISALDVLYGHRQFIANGNHYMAHKCGFTYKALDAVLSEAGFISRAGICRPEVYDLWIIGFKNKRSQAEMTDYANRFFP